MKHTILGLGLWLLLIGAGTGIAQWSSPTEISWGSVPDMDIDPRTGNVHVVIVSNTQQILYTLLNAEGRILNQETVPHVNNERGEGYFGPSIAVDTLGFPHIAFRNYNGNNTFDLHYIYKNARGWSEDLKVADAILRGYSFRIDVDRLNRVHLAYGSASKDVWGPVTYLRIERGVVVDLQTGLTKYRADDRIEIDARGRQEVHLIMGCPDPDGGPVTYWRSTNGGEVLEKVADIHHPDCRDRNGSPDLFVDQQGDVHCCYGASKDASRGDLPSVRYTRYQNITKQMDMAVTPAGFLESWHQDLGLASIATSDNGEYIIIAFLKTDGGPLFTIHSDDAGQTWMNPMGITTQNFPGHEGRNKHLIRARGDRFYLIYPDANGKVMLRWYETMDRQAPKAVLGGPYRGREGRPVTFDASKSTDNQRIVSYEWDWNADAIFDLTTSVPVAQHIFEDNYQGTVILKAIDRSQNWGLDTTEVIIENTNPHVEVGSDLRVNEGATVPFTASVLDSGRLDTHTFQWNFGDGKTGTGASISHVYVDNGLYTVVCVATDKDGGAGQDQKLVTVDNVAPVANAGGPYRGVAGDTLLLVGNATDAGAADLANLAFQWDLDQDGSFEVNGRETFKKFSTDGRFSITLRVMDDDGGIGADTALVIITGAAPAVKTIPNQTIQEGGNFQPINLDLYVTDRDHTPAQMRWNATGLTNLKATIINRIVSVTAPNPDWTGAEVLQLVATDPTNLSDTARVTLTVLNVNDYPIAKALNNQTIKENEAFRLINLNPLVQDVDNSPTEMTWSYFGNQALRVQLQLTGENHPTATRALPNSQSGVWAAQIAVADSEWSGSEAITFVVTDPGQLADSTTAVFTVTPVNDPPQIRAIPTQILTVGQEFPVLNLDEFVFDPDHPADQLNWQVTGNQKLQVQIVARQARVRIPAPYWQGEEKLVFTATDPNGAAAQQTVVFIASFNNRPPQLAPMEPLIFNEDDTTYLSRARLVALTTDPDNSANDFNYSLLTSLNLRWGIHAADRGLFLTTQPDWNGKETVTLVVDDGLGGLDSTRFSVTVNPVNDPPSKFQLLEPLDQNLTDVTGNIQFKWRRAHDPEGTTVHYYWLLSRAQNFADSLAQAFVTDSVYTLPTTALNKHHGDFYWKVTAFSYQDNLVRESENTGHFIRGGNAVENPPEPAGLPTSLQLFPNYPNPFNPETQITYQLPGAQSIRLEIFNLNGKLVRTLFTGVRPTGQYVAVWDGCDQLNQPVSSGFYICRLQAGDQVLMQKMLLTR
ncbi:PKD domain-containing protein [candidate division KSB1 bacterium]|nr:PKD domain-containing protein [candidate division KSB1 bacterium]